jgi:glyoxylase-like metal-dependent hydrolase (beta-lactamase superfamily II)
VVDLDLSGPRPATGTLDVRWIHGSRSRRRPTDPPVQVHAYCPHTWLLRQSKDATFEAPFLALVGTDRALLLDSGATRDRSVREAVDRLLPAGHPLVVAHTHAHRDHRTGDESFADRPDTVVVGMDLASVRDFFGFSDWPDATVRFELGDRTLELTGIPGHEQSSVAVWDPWSGLLFSGDTVYPGRLYVEDMPAFADSVRRLVDFAEARPVAHVLGCHIEMTRQPGRDYPFGCRYQPDEPPPQLTVADLRAVRDAAERVRDRRGIHRFDRFVIYHDPPRRALAGQVVRALTAAVRRRLSR